MRADKHDRSPRIGRLDLNLAYAAGRALRHRTRHLVRRNRSRMRWLAGWLDGAAYRAAGRQPSGDVPDQVIAERVRAELGVELKRLGLRDIHVESIGHVAYLRGAAEFGDARHLEKFVSHVPGVVGVESYLDVTARPRPGESIRMPSDALIRMLALAREEGCHSPRDRTAVIAVLATFAARIPPGELRQVWTHLPVDLRGMLQPPVRLGAAPRRLRRPAEFYAAVAAAAGVDLETAERLTRHLLGELRRRVPEEVADIQAILPTHLKAVWDNAAVQ